MTGMTWICAMVLLQAPPALSVSVETLSGPKRTGALVELTTERVTIEVDGQRSRDGTCTICWRWLSTYARRQSWSNPPATSAWIELVDGSRLEATSYTVHERVAVDPSRRSCHLAWTRGTS